jgi:hypothetical protein
VVHCSWLVHSQWPLPEHALVASCRPQSDELPPVELPAVELPPVELPPVELPPVAELPELPPVDAVLPALLLLVPPDPLLVDPPVVVLLPPVLVLVPPVALLPPTVDVLPPEPSESSSESLPQPTANNVSKLESARCLTFI